MGRPYEPPIGAIGTVSLPESKLARFQISIVEAAIQFDTQSPVHHAVIYMGEGRVLEARPGGAGWNTVAHYGTDLHWSSVPPPACSRDKMDDVAKQLYGTKYSFEGLFCIGIAQKRFSKERYHKWIEENKYPWWAKRVSDDGDLFCSQLDDEFYLRCGSHLFSDGRLPGLVSPGDLYALGVVA